MFIRILLVLSFVASLSACAQEEYLCIEWVLVWDSENGMQATCVSNPCVQFCITVRPKLIDQMPDVSPEEVNCSEPIWSEATTCEECMSILEERWDVTATGPYCSRWDTQQFLPVW